MTWFTEVRLEDFGRQWVLISGDVNQDGEATALSNIEYTKHIPGDLIKNVPVDRGLLQSIVDACWKVGIRPEALNAIDSEIGATKRHLEDMRSIAFHKVGAEKP